MSLFLLSTGLKAQYTVQNTKPGYNPWIPTGKVRFLKRWISWDSTSTSGGKTTYYKGQYLGNLKQIEVVYKPDPNHPYPGDEVNTGKTTWKDDSKYKADKKTLSRHADAATVEALPINRSVKVTH